MICAIPEPPPIPAQISHIILVSFAVGGFAWLFTGITLDMPGLSSICRRSSWENVGETTQFITHAMWLIVGRGDISIQSCTVVPVRSRARFCGFSSDVLFVGIVSV